MFSEERGVSTISNLLSKSQRIGDVVPSLSGLFSDTQKEKFKRTQKPQEFSLKKRQSKSDEDEQSSTCDKFKKKKKVKLSGQYAAVLSAPPIESLVSNIPEPSSLLNDLTIFVGNLPLSSTSKSIAKLFCEFGEISSIRLRSVPIAGVKVDDPGNQALVKKVCVNSKLFGIQKGSLNAYIVFKSLEAASAALSANNKLVDKRHIRVDKVIPTLFDTNNTVFLGSLPHFTDEEELREYFAKVLPGGHDDIISLRLIRDPESLIGKGIGYLQLKDRDSVLRALSLHQQKFKKRDIRVTM